MMGTATDDNDIGIPVCGRRRDNRSGCGRKGSALALPAIPEKPRKFADRWTLNLHSHVSPPARVISKTCIFVTDIQSADKSIPTVDDS